MRLTRVILIGVLTCLLLAGCSHNGSSPKPKHYPMTEKPAVKAEVYRVQSIDAEVYQAKPSVPAQTYKSIEPVKTPAVKKQPVVVHLKVAPVVKHRQTAMETKHPAVHKKVSVIKKTPVQVKSTGYRPGMTLEEYKKTSPHPELVSHLPLPATYEGHDGGGKVTK